MLHKCMPVWAERESQEFRDVSFSAYGPAITECCELDDGELWVSNDEYATRVNFCPFCGYKAKKLVAE